LYELHLVNPGTALQAIGVSREYTNAISSIEKFRNKTSTDITGNTGNEAV
jgi:hypothetical protein